jgi:hypothetical protein
MTRRFVRLTLFAVLLLAFGAAAYHIALLERSLGAEDARADAAARAAASALDALLELRAAERAYIAEGQGVPYWHARAASALTGLRAELDTLRRTAVSPASRTTLDTIEDTLGRVARLEDRIAEHALAGRRPHAEDLIFADAVQASTVLERDLRAATAIDREDSRGRTRAIREQELLILALAGAVALLVALMLVPVPRAQNQEPPPREVAETGDLPLNLRAAPGLTSRPASALLPDPALPQVLPAVADGGDRAATAAKLHAAADLCGALARVQRSDDLPALFARISRILDAQGLIVWMSDAGAHTLTPVLSHGYRSESLARVGSIGWDEKNPAAEAFRRDEPRLIEASDRGPAAIAVPLLAASGSVGVVTIELKDGSRPDLARLDLTRIFAAQLAGLIAPAAPADSMAEASRASATPAV